MSAQQNDGGPAFPREYVTNGVPGMSLRDWFAGQAMAAFIASSEMNGNDTAETAYAFADAMIAARGQA